MTMMKICGKYSTPTFRQVSLTFTNGWMALTGAITASTAYQYTQKISVAEGNIVTLQTTAGAASPLRVVTAFNGNTAVEEKGWKPESGSTDAYEVPNGIDSIVITAGGSGGTRVANIVTVISYAKGIEVDQEGIMLTRHVWETKQSTICYNEAITDTSGHSYPSIPIDISGYAVTSLRVVSSLNQPVTLILFDDLFSGRWLGDIGGDAASVAIPAGNMCTVITPDDLPALNYLQNLKVRISAATAPTSGSISVYAVSKR